MSIHDQPTIPVIAIQNNRPKKQYSLSPRIVLIIIALLVLLTSTITALIFVEAAQQHHSATTNTVVGSGPWHTSGGQIYDASNRPVRITGVNWFGFETDSFVVHGLENRNYMDMLKQMRDLGYNTIRLPYSSQFIDTNSQPNGIDYSKNPDLRGLQGLALMDKIVDGASKLGLHIILDHHRSDAYAQSPLWYTSTYPESHWISDWQMLAKHYQDNTMVIGADLDNEPHSPACWGCKNPTIDWQLAAQVAGNAILSVNPNWLIFVEGVDCYGPGGSTQPGSSFCTWWGENLQGVKTTPVVLSKPGKLVYSVHDYPASVGSQPWFQDANYPNNLTQLWEQSWGYIQHQGIAPVWVGEFGSMLQTQSDQQWFSTLINYLGQGVNGFNWTFWCWNPDSSDTGGILQDDWSTVNMQKQDALSTIQFAMGGQNSAQHGTQTPTTPTPFLTPTQPALQNVLTLDGQSNNSNAITNQLQIALKLTNTGYSTIDLKAITIRYWYTEDSTTQQHIACDYVTINCSNVQTRIVPMQTPVANADQYLEISFSGGSLIANASTEIKLRVYKIDWSNYNQDNDYSFTANMPIYQSAPHIGLYQQGKLIEGQAPA